MLRLTGKTLSITAAHGDTPAEVCVELETGSQVTMSSANPDEIVKWRVGEAIEFIMRRPRKPRGPNKRTLEKRAAEAAGNGNYDDSPAAA